MNSPARFMMFNRKQKTVVCRAQQVRPEEDIHTPGFTFPKLTLTRRESPSRPCARGHLGDEPLAHLGTVVSWSWVVLRYLHCSSA